MRNDIRYTALAACLAYCVPHAAAAAPKYQLQPLSAIANKGSFFPVALADNGVAFGTFQDRATLGLQAMFASHAVSGVADHCGLQGPADRTEITAISPYSTVDALVDYEAGTCDLGGTSYLYNVPQNTTVQVAYPGADQTFVNGVNAGGLAVGSYFDSQDIQHGYYLFGAEYIPFDPAGSVGTTTMGINTNNTVFGFYKSSDTVYHGFLLSLDGTYTVLTYPGAKTTAITGLTAGNQAVGDFFADPSVPQQVFSWQNGTFKVLPIASSGSNAAGVSANGVVAGTYTDASNISHGYVWQPASGQLIKFDTPPGTFKLTVTGINRFSQVTGYYTKGNRQVAFIGSCKGTGCI